MIMSLVLIELAVLVRQSTWYSTVAAAGLTIIPIPLLRGILELDPAILKGSS